MGYSNGFIKSLGYYEVTTKNFSDISKKTSIPTKTLKYYNSKNILPSGNDLDVICNIYNISEDYLKLKMGVIDYALIEKLQYNAKKINEEIEKTNINNDRKKDNINVVFDTEKGILYQGDCLDVMSGIQSDSIDMIFADPPFNLDKLYPSAMNDKVKEEDYIKWSESWIKECIRILKPGGSFFTWNLPQWNSRFSGVLHGRMTFKHWIATDIKYSMPIKGRLYPSHYSLLYYVKGEKANVFHADRMAAQVCPKCFDDIKDYGGYKHKMNPLGISLTDVWTDIPPVRHQKYKKREGSNELSIKLIDRIIELSTNENDVVFDPFGGAGTTYVVAEMKNRRWLGCEIDSCNIIADRFMGINDEKRYLDEIRNKYNHLFPSKTKKERENRGLWTAESAKKKHEEKQNLKK
ncbi:site-specific DNA-methyltransferase [Photobacterium carnosum]|uniref:DNA-methyltransferase n=1 Tax=Photobacterium carnosum TaxID=2023717 RepID=UPI001F3490A1|nr:site-specific DNA-methyltransferase [Photobacterium carnosum]MCF2307962.1 site-specific DNA-methyltransferase [Photobacterium carnosum]